MAGRSGMDMQNLGYSQAYNLQQTQPRGGGGGGGGAAGLGGYGGTGMSFQDYLNAQNQSKLALQQGLNALNPQAKGPSYGSQLFGQALGTGLGLAGAYAFS